MRDGDRLVPSFPNARFWSNERHWKWATEPNAREKASFLKENILPIQESGQLNFVQEQSTLNPGAPLPLHPSGILPGLQFYFAHGHTDAMMIPVIHHHDRTLVFMADLLPSAAHIPLPYVMAYDMFPLTTLNEKKYFLETAAQQNFILFYQHDPVNECGVLQTTEKGVRSGELFSLVSYTGL